MQQRRSGRLTPERATDLGVMGGLLYALLICRFDPPLHSGHTFTAVAVGTGLWLAFRWLARGGVAAD